MAHASVVNLNSDLMSLRRGNFDVFDGKLLACLPGDGGLASNGLVMAMNLSDCVCLISRSGSGVIERFAAAVVVHVSLPFPQCRS